MAEPERIVTGFARVLRANGLSVPTGMAILFAEALALVGLDARTKVYWAGRATLVRRLEDIPVYDRVFAAYWQDRADQIEPAPVPVAPRPHPGARRRRRRVRVRRRTTLRPATCWPCATRLQSSCATRTCPPSPPTEWAEAQRLISALGIAAELQAVAADPAHPAAVAGPSGPPSAPCGAACAPVACRSGEPGGLRLPGPAGWCCSSTCRGAWSPTPGAWPVSPTPPSVARRSGRVEVFTIGTRLTRITRELARRDPDAALASAAESVADWSGGTRLGASLAEFNDRLGRAGHGPGGGGGDLQRRLGPRRSRPSSATEMARLSRVARRVVWVNPLKASPGYAPLARGMAAALPFVDQFVEGHAVSSLERLAEVIAGTATKEPRP